MIVTSYIERLYFKILANWGVIFFTKTCAGLEQYAIQKFAESLEIIPRTLAENAGVKATEVISKLYAAHQGGDKNAGFDNEVWFLLLRKQIRIKDLCRSFICS